MSEELELDQEELEWLLSTLRAQLDVMKQMSESDFGGIKMKLWKKILKNTGSFTDKELDNITTKDDVVKFHEEIIAEYETYLEFDPEQDVAVQYLREIGAREELIEQAKSRVTPDNIIRA